MNGDIYTHRRGRTAIHEAGHALVALEEGKSFDDIVLGKTADANGVMRNISLRRGDDEVVRIALGGILAVRLCRPRWYWQLFANAHDDLGIIADFYRGTDDADWGVEYNVKTTITLLSESWSTVEALARELLKHRRLSCGTASAIFEKKHVQRRPPTQLDEAGWKPLIDHVHWRIKYPRGTEDALRALADAKIG